MANMNPLRLGGVRLVENRYSVEESAVWVSAVLRSGLIVVSRHLIPLPHQESAESKVLRYRWFSSMRCLAAIPDHYIIISRPMPIAIYPEDWARQKKLR